MEGGFLDVLRIEENMEGIRVIIEEFEVFMFSVVLGDDS